MWKKVVVAYFKVPLEYKSEVLLLEPAFELK
jgi:hypothetical protein